MPFNLQGDAHLTIITLSGSLTEAEIAVRRALVGSSIPTDSDEYRQIFEPHADPIDERLAALRTLHAAG